MSEFCQELAAFALGTAKRCHEGAVAAAAAVKAEEGAVKEEDVAGLVVD